MTNTIPNPTLIEAREWAEEHRDVLQIAYRHFEQNEEWPTLEYLQHRLETEGRFVSVHNLINGAPPIICSLELQRLRLRPRGLAYVSTAQELLADWAAVTALAYRLWLADPERKLLRADVEELLESDPDRTRRVLMIFERETWFFDGGQGAVEDQSWSRGIHSRVRLARSADTANELIAALDADEFPPFDPDEIVYTGPMPATSTEAATPRLRRTRKLWMTISENALISAVIAGLIVLLLGYFLK